MIVSPALLFMHDTHAAMNARAGKVELLDFEFGFAIHNPYEDAKER